MTAAVDTSLASSVLAILDTVRADLETATPRVGRIETQVEAAFAWHQHSFVKLAAADLAQFGELPARATAETLADAVTRTAAFAVAEGMDLQLARGWAPAVAWQRVLVAYGLDSRRMHAYLGAVLGGDPKEATTVVPPAARAAVERQRIAYCDEVGRDGMAAAKSCVVKEELSKDYDPQQIRGEHGRWAKQPVSRTRVAERERDPEVEPELDRYATAEPDRYATAEVDRYATAEPDRYATAEVDRYAAAEPDRYAVAGNDRYAAAAASDDRYAQATRSVLRRHLVVMMTPTPPKTEEDVIEAEEETKATAEATGGGFYLPSTSLDRYHGRSGRQRVIDFAHVKKFHQDEYGATLDVHRAIPGVELQHARNAWSVAEGVDIDDQVWGDLVDEALPLFDAVMDDPVDAADQLYGDDLTFIADQAGFPGSDPVMVKREIADAVQRRDSGIDFDESLLNALADHIVWRDPGLLGDRGDAFAQTLEDHGVEKKLEGATPEVLSFNGGLADDDNAADLTGTYYAKTTIYHSALGTFGSSAPVGFIGLREVTMRPRV